MKHYLIVFFLILSFSALNGQEISKKELKYKPVNLNEAVLQLTKVLPDSTQQEVLTMTENEFLSGSHFGLGMWIRNNWRLWKGGELADSFKAMGIFHPDDMSGIILTCYYRQLHHQNWELEKQIKTYQDYWKATNEHFQKLKTDTVYQREVQLKQDSVKREYLNKKKLAWKTGAVISGYLGYQCGFIDLGENTKIQGTIIEWQGDSVVIRITKYFDEKKKKRVMKCNNIEDNIVVIQNHEMFGLEE